jgi:hypothetical protein
MADEQLDAVMQRMRDRQASAIVVEREASLREWLTEQFVKRADDDQREEREQ